jgi:coenzyme F420-reducing hydrogenase delta subunit
MTADSFEPVILAFCCQYCSYHAADLAGSLRLSYPPNVRIIRTQCSGRVDALSVLAAFENGVDGVMVTGCMEGDCHFLEGNFRARARVTHVKKLLDDAGVGGDRVEMFNISASMGKKFADSVSEFTRKIRELGPSPAKTTAPDEDTQSAAPERRNRRPRSEGSLDDRSGEKAV